MSDGFYSNDASGWYSGGAGDVPGGNPYTTADYSTQPQAAWGQSSYGQSQYDPYGASAAAEPQSYYGGQMFVPNEAPPPGAAGSPQDDVSFEDEPPLLEELGINFDHIKQKTVAVLNPLKDASAEVIADQDLAGPLVFCLLLGSALLLHGKVSFGYIYGIGVLGCVGMYYLLNLMASERISLTCTVSVLGYCLLPMALLSLLGVVVNFKGYLGLLVSVLAVLWCSVTSSKLFVTALAMQHQRLLVAYPCLLLYGLFALLAVF